MHVRARTERESLNMVIDTHRTRARTHKERESQHGNKYSPYGPPRW